MPNLVSISESGTCRKSINISLDWHPKKTNICEFGKHEYSYFGAKKRHSKINFSKLVKVAAAEFSIVFMSKSSQHQPIQVMDLIANALVKSKLRRSRIATWKAYFGEFQGHHMKLNESFVSLIINIDCGVVFQYQDNMVVEKRKPSCLSKELFKSMRLLVENQTQN